MGLDTSHDCWHGSYSSFNSWRHEIARVAGMPPLGFMEGFYSFTNITLDDASVAVKAIGFDTNNAWARELISALYRASNLPLRWDMLKPSPLHTLLNHSDCDGEINTADCLDLANALEELLPKLILVVKL